jgi:hypothetical protein
LLDRIRLWQGFTLIFVEGFYGRVRRMVGYDSGKVGLRFGWFPFIFRKANIYASNGHTLLAVLLSAWAVLLVFVFDGDSVAAPFWLLSFTRARKNIQVLVAFILGGFVVRVVSSWTTRRGNYTRLLIRSSAILLKVATFLKPRQGNTSREARAAAEKLRAQVGRYVQLGIELTIAKARGEMETTKGREYFQSKGLLAPGEWERMVPGHRQTTAWLWISLVFEEAWEHDLLDNRGRVQLAQAITDLHETGYDLLLKLGNDVPFPYAQLVMILAKMLLFIVITEGALEMAVEYRKTPVLGVFETVVWTLLNVMFFFVATCGLQGFLDLQDVLYNPFGPNVNDVAHESLAPPIGTLAEHFMALEPLRPPIANLGIPLREGETECSKAVLQSAD